VARRRVFGALEVCAFTDSERQAQWAARDDDEGSFRRCCRWPGTCNFARGARTKGTPASAERHLLVLEQHGRNRYYAGDHYMLLAEFGSQHPLVVASTALVALGVVDTAGTVPPPGQRPTIAIVTGAGEVSALELVNTAVEDRAWEPANRRKLAAAQHATARNLFGQSTWPRT
jgi:hypothetical protein